MSAPDDSPHIPVSALHRRSFLGLVGTSAAAATMATACRAAPPEEIVPYVRRPPEVLPGRSRFYATASLRSGYAVGLLGEGREGRPIKIEGNPRHPASLGATGVWEQASLLSLYDADRAREIEHRGRPSSWRDLVEELERHADSDLLRRGGEGLHLWLEPTSSPVIEMLLGRLREKYPRMQVWFDPSWASVNRWRGARLAFGRTVETMYRFEHAERVLALDADFLTGMPFSIRWARELAKRRALDGPEGSMNRMYAVDPKPTVTSTTADHRLAVRAREVALVAMGVMGELARHTEIPEPFAARAAEWRDLAPHTEWIRAVAKDLWEHRRHSAVVVGDRQPPEVHALGHALNEILQNVDHTVYYVPASVLEAGEDSFQPGPFFSAADAGDVRTLVTLEANPGYTAPEMWRYERPLGADVHIHAAAFHDETGDAADWFVPTRHYLESWNAARAADGTLTTIQPLVRPLFGGLQIEQVLAALLGASRREPRRLLLEAWKQVSDTPLERALGVGLVAGTAHEPLRVEPSWGRVVDSIRPPEIDHDQWELVIEPDPRIIDGRFANNAWLQELPEPITKLVWDNAALMSQSTAEELGVARGQVLDLKHGTTRVKIPAWPMPGIPERTLVVWLGYGRRDAGTVGTQVGVDITPLREPGSWVTEGVLLTPTGDEHDLVTTQWHEEMEGRPAVLRETLEGFRKHPEFAEPHDATPLSIYPSRVPEDVVQWGMAIDLNKCTGCSACVVACQAENNIPSVGKTQCGLGREMHWLRIDRYYTGDAGHETVDFQPMLCQHCEQAPCEYVCPVYATVHSPDGLNEMIYNRCVGTRFCSNNCPYKVRRFNWYDFFREIPETRKMAMNPDVTVRARGVMEKCTYCVQRIRRSEIEAQLEGRRLRDEDVITACQQACPTEAIVFGQVSDHHSRVSQLFRNPRAYAALNDLGTRPRTRYLAHIVNPNPELEG